MQKKIDETHCSSFFGKRTMSLCVEMKQEINETRKKIA